MMIEFHRGTSVDYIKRETRATALVYMSKKRIKFLTDTGFRFAPVLDKR
jgi:hypothetical protein